MKSVLVLLNLILLIFWSSVCHELKIMRINCKNRDVTVSCKAQFFPSFKGSNHYCLLAILVVTIFFFFSSYVSVCAVDESPD